MSINNALFKDVSQQCCYKKRKMENMILIAWGTVRIRDK